MFLLRNLYPYTRYVPRWAVVCCFVTTSFFRIAEKAVALVLCHTLLDKYLLPQMDRITTATNTNNPKSIQRPNSVVQNGIIAAEMLETAWKIIAIKTLPPVLLYNQV